MARNRPPLDQHVRRARAGFGQAGRRRLLGRVVRAVPRDRARARRDRRETSEQITIAKVNVDDNPELAQRFNVMSIPTLLVFYGGEVSKKLVGAKGKTQLLQELDEFLVSTH